jgi:hypothetical protein
MAKYQLKNKTYLFISMGVKPTSAYKIHELVIYVETSYMFRSHFVAILRSVLYQGYVTKISQAFYVHVTVHRDGILHNNQLDGLISQIHF